MGTIMTNVTDVGKCHVNETLKKRIITVILSLHILILKKNKQTTFLQQWNKILPSHDKHDIFIWRCVRYIKTDTGRYISFCNTM